MTKEVKWKKNRKRDYPAAVSYLTLIFPKVSAEGSGKRLERRSHESSSHRKTFSELLVYQNYHSTIIM